MFPKLAKLVKDAKLDTAIRISLKRNSSFYENRDECGHYMLHHATDQPAGRIFVCPDCDNAFLISMITGKDLKNIESMIAEDAMRRAKE